MNKTKIIHVAIEPDKYRKLKALSVEWGLSVSQVIRSAVRQVLDSEPEPRQERKPQ